MGASNSETSNAKFYSLKAKVDVTNDPHFALSEKVDGKWTTTGKFNKMSGTLISAEIVEKEFEGSKKNFFVIVLKDPNEESKITMSHNQITYSIISSLASLEVPGAIINMRLYKTQSDKYWNGNVAIEADGQKLAWSIHPKDAPKPEVVMVNNAPFIKDGKKVYDSSAKAKFYEELFTSKVVSKLSNKPSKPMTSDEFINDINTAVEPDADF